jgi:hypothetical protein
MPIKFNPFSKLVHPKFPPAAIGIENDFASAVLLENRKESMIQSAAHVQIPSGLITPSFDDPNIYSTSELVDILAEVVTSAGLDRIDKWSVTLPEASIRTMIITLETPTTSSKELDEMLKWKLERSFNTPYDEMRLSWIKLSSDSRARERYLAIAIRLSVLAEYELVFEKLGWHVGLILPRHMGELRWFSNKDNRNRDDLLISSNSEGFAAVIMRDGQTLLTRLIPCEDEESCSDELFRLLLFYKDRLLGAEETEDVNRTIERVLIIGHKFDKEEVLDVISETLHSLPENLTPDDLGMSLPSSDLDFDLIAAPAGLATLSFN